MSTQPTLGSFLHSFFEDHLICQKGAALEYSKLSRRNQTISDIRSRRQALQVDATWCVGHDQ